jgi:hypothetical protein
MGHLEILKSRQNHFFKSITVGINYPCPCTPIPDTESWPTFLDNAKKNDVNQSLVSLINDTY